MEKTCQMCGTTSSVEPGPMAMCSKCGGYFIKTDAMTAEQRARVKSVAASDSARVDIVKPEPQPKTPPPTPTPTPTVLAAPLGPINVKPRQPMGSALEKTLWAATVVGAILAILQVSLTMAAVSAPQQAAGSALALAYCVVPYVLARAVQEFRR